MYRKNIINRYFNIMDDETSISQKPTSNSIEDKPNVSTMTITCDDHCPGGCVPNCYNHWRCFHCGHKYAIIGCNTLWCTNCDYKSHHCNNNPNPIYCQQCNIIAKTFAYDDPIQCSYCTPNNTVDSQRVDQDV